MVYSGVEERDICREKRRGNTKKKEILFSEIRSYLCTVSSSHIADSGEKAVGKTETHAVLRHTQHTTRSTQHARIHVVLILKGRRYDEEG